MVYCSVEDGAGVVVSSAIVVVGTGVVDGAGVVVSAGTVVVGTGLESSQIKSIPSFEHE